MITKANRYGECLDSVSLRKRVGGKEVGSCGAFRFRAEPKVVKLEGSKEVDFKNSTIVAEFWHGPFCYEKSEMEGSEVFPMSEDGRTAMKAWLEANI